MKIVTLLFVLFFANIAFAANPKDSLRVETINGQKFIIHKVAKGETLTILAKRYNVSETLITKANSLLDVKLAKNQLIKIPFVIAEVKVGASTLANDSIKVDEAHANAQAVESIKIYFHQVASGENINLIAKKYKISAAQITKWNSLKSNKLVVGQVLAVNENAAAKPYNKLNGTESQLPQLYPKPKLANAILVVDSGLAIVDEGELILHATLPVGTLIKVINQENGKQCLVKITGVLNVEKYQNFKLTLGQIEQEKLQTNSPIIKVKLEFIAQY